MPKRIFFLFFFVFLFNLVFLSRISFAQNPQNDDTIKIGYFTPPPSYTPTSTSTPSPSPFIIYVPPASPTKSSTSTLPTSAVPPGDFSGVSDTVISLTNNVRAVCPEAVVTKDSVSCLYKLTLPQARRNPVIFEMDRSAQSFYYLQCVGYVRAAVTLMTGNTLNNGGNAVDYFTNIPTGYKAIRRTAASGPPKVNDIVIWNTDTYGHIAYVTRVFDNRAFQIAEANYGRSGLVQLRNTTVDSPGMLGWLRKE